MKVEEQKTLVCSVWHIGVDVNQTKGGPKLCHAWKDAAREAFWICMYCTLKPRLGVTRISLDWLWLPALLFIYCFDFECIKVIQCKQPSQVDNEESFGGKILTNHCPSLQSCPWGICTFHNATSSVPIPVRGNRYHYSMVPILCGFLF